MTTHFTIQEYLNENLHKESFKNVEELLLANNKFYLETEYEGYCELVKPKRCIATPKDVTHSLINIYKTISLYNFGKYFIQIYALALLSDPSNFKIVYLPNSVEPTFEAAIEYYGEKNEKLPLFLGAATAPDFSKQDAEHNLFYTTAHLIIRGSLAYLSYNLEENFIKEFSYSTCNPNISFFADMEEATYNTHTACNFDDIIKSQLTYKIDANEYYYSIRPKFSQTEEKGQHSWWKIFDIFFQKEANHLITFQDKDSRLENFIKNHPLCTQLQTLNDEVVCAGNTNTQTNNVEEL